jgi:hypothetical protein|nr:hypothetical protein [Dehalococcoides mccartyi]
MQNKNSFSKKDIFIVIAVFIVFILSITTITLKVF